MPTDGGLQTTQTLHTGGTANSVIRSLVSLIQQRVPQLLGTLRSRTQARELHVVETVSLGEKRFLSVVVVDGERLLIGGGCAGVCLLKSLRQAGEQSSSAEGLETVRASRGTNSTAGFSSGWHGCLSARSGQ